MRNLLRRYEVLLPVRFNDGRRVPKSWLARAFNEVVDHFGAASYECQAVEGKWRNGRKVFRDYLSRIIVDVPDTPESRRWMRQFKSRWKVRLDQLELWMVSYRIDVE